MSASYLYFIFVLLPNIQWIFSVYFFFAIISGGIFFSNCKNIVQMKNNITNFKKRVSLFVLSLIISGIFIAITPNSDEVKSMLVAHYISNTKGIETVMPSIVKYLNKKSE